MQPLDKPQEEPCTQSRQPVEHPRPLDVGVIIDDAGWVADWQWWLLERLADDERFRLTARVEPGVRQPHRELPALLTGLLKLDGVFFARTKPFVRNAIEACVDALPELAPSQCISPKADHAQHTTFDVVLRLGVGSLASDDLGIARHGEWFVDFLTTDTLRPDLAGFDGVRRNAESVALRVMVRQHGRNGPNCIASADYSPKFSAARTSVFLGEKAAILMHQALASLAYTGRAPTVALPQNAVEPTAGVPAFNDLTAYSWQLTRSVGQRLSQAFHQRIHRDLDSWHLAIGKGSPSQFDPVNSTILDRVAFNMADPFLIMHQERLYVFYESDNGGGEHAAISVGLIENNRLRPLGEALRCDYHLSYPHVFRHAGEIYMMPETQQARRLEIWRCVEFPCRWERHAMAFEGRHLADSNLFELNGKWWLFTNLSDHKAFQDHSSELFIYQTDGPDLKRLVSHPLNPVVVGSRQARNAGPIIVEGKKLFRPTQIHAFDTYGYGLNICEIEHLSMSDYRERLVRRIRPGFYEGHIGIHHASFAGGYFVVDMHTTRVASRSKVGVS